MKIFQWIITGGLVLSLFTGCNSKTDLLPPALPETEQQPPEVNEGAENLPEGCFEVNFSPTFGNRSRAAVTGADGRVTATPAVKSFPNADYWFL